MTRRAIWGNIQFEGGSIGPSTAELEVQYRSRELNIPHIARSLGMHLMYDLSEWLANQKGREKEKKVAFPQL